MVWAPGRQADVQADVFSAQGRCSALGTMLNCASVTRPARPSVIDLRSSSSGVSHARHTATLGSPPGASQVRLYRMMRPAAFIASRPSTMPLCFVGFIKSPLPVRCCDQGAKKTTAAPRVKFRKRRPSGGPCRRAELAAVSPVNEVTSAAECTCETAPTPTVGFSSLAWPSGFWPRPPERAGVLFFGPAGCRSGHRRQALQELPQNRSPFFGLEPARELPLVALELDIGDVDACRFEPFQHTRADRSREQRIRLRQHVEHF